MEPVCWLALGVVVWVVAVRLVQFFAVPTETLDSVSDAWLQERIRGRRE